MNSKTFFPVLSQTISFLGFHLEKTCKYFQSRNQTIKYLCPCKHKYKCNSCNEPHIVVAFVSFSVSDEQKSFILVKYVPTLQRKKTLQVYKSFTRLAPEQVWG